MSSPITTGINPRRPNASRGPASPARTSAVSCANIARSWPEIRGLCRPKSDQQQGDQRPPGDDHLFAGVVMTGGRGDVMLAGVGEHGPQVSPATGDDPPDLFLRGMEQHHEGAAPNAPAAWITVGDLVAVEDHPERSLPLVEPLVVADLASRGQKPGDVLAAGSVHGLTGEEVSPAQHRVAPPQRDHPRDEPEHLLVDVLPVE